MLRSLQNSNGIRK